MILIPIKSNARSQGLNRVLAVCVVEPTKEVIMFYLNTVNLFGILTEETGEEHQHVTLAI